MPLHTCPRRLAFVVWVESNRHEGPFAEKSEARLLGLSFYGKTQVRLRKCFLDDNLRRKSLSHRAKIVVDAAVCSFRKHDRVKACSPNLKQDLRRTGIMSLHTCPRRRRIPAWVGRNQDEVPFTENSVARLLGLSFFSDTQVRVRKCISDTTGFFDPAKNVIDVGVGSFRRHDRLGS